MLECEYCHRTNTTIRWCKQAQMYLCSKHYHHIERHGRIIPDEERIKRCEICGISNKEQKVSWCEKAGKILCNKHRSQINRLGYIKERTKRDKNLYILHEDYAEILFEDKDGNVIDSAIIDLCDVEKCKPYKWMITEYMGNTRYVKAIINKKNTSLHRFILDYSGNMFVDHIDRNGLNNKRNNLRIVTESENSVNSKTRSATGEKNIYFKNNKFNVQIIRHYKTVYYGTFNTLDEAIYARDAFVEKYNKTHNRQV